MMRGAETKILGLWRKEIEIRILLYFLLFNFYFNNLINLFKEKLHAFLHI